MFVTNVKSKIICKVYKRYIYMEKEIEGEEINRIL